MAKNTAPAEGFTRFTIDLPTEIAIETAGVRVMADASKLSPELVARIAEFGLFHKARNAAAGAIKAAGFDPKLLSRDDMGEEDLAKVNAKSVELIQGTLDNLYAGVWAERRAGGASVDPRVSAIRVVLRPNVAEAYDAENGKGAWKALEDDEQAAIIDATYPTLSEEDAAVVNAAVEARLEELARKREQRKSVGSIRVKLAK